MQQLEAFVKVIRTIYSCKTADQFKSAHKMIDNFDNMFHDVHDKTLLEGFFVDTIMERSQVV